MPKVSVSMPALTVTDRGWERNKEVYVLSLATDLRGEDPNRNNVPIAAYNETLSNVAPAAQAAAALKYVIVAVSNVFQRVRPDQPASISGSGIILYPNLDPMGMLGLHIAVIESDEKTRDVGKLLTSILEAPEVVALTQALAAGITQPLLAQLMNVLIGRVPKVLIANRDDILFTHNHSGFDYDDYGLDPGARIADFKVGNDRARATIRVRLG